MHMDSHPFTSSLTVTGTLHLFLTAGVCAVSWEQLRR